MHFVTLKLLALRARVLFLFYLLSFYHFANTYIRDRSKVDCAGGDIGQEKDAQKL